ncbi:hypothetical protein K432DRAFT_456789, partial [Lepidopterella palustris CBS 459.81]
GLFTCTNLHLPAPEPISWKPAIKGTFELIDWTYSRMAVPSIGNTSSLVEVSEQHTSCDNGCRTHWFVAMHVRGTYSRNLVAAGRESQDRPGQAQETSNQGRSSKGGRMDADGDLSSSLGAPEAPWSLMVRAEAFVGPRRPTSYTMAAHGCPWLARKKVKLISRQRLRHRGVAHDSSWAVGSQRRGQPPKKLWRFIRLSCHVTHHNAWLARVLPVPERKSLQHCEMNSLRLPGHRSPSAYLHKEGS